MRNYMLCFCLMLMTCYGLDAQQIIELEPQQSMGITGKGKGQDGAINPYMSESSIGIVENIGEHSFYVRIQEKSKILAEVEVAVNETKEFYLKPGFEMYFDAKKSAKTKVSFKKYKE